MGHVSVSVSLATVFGFLSVAVDLDFVCFYGFGGRTKQGRGSVVFFICFLSKWTDVIVLACEAQKKRQRMREEFVMNLCQ